MNNGRSAWPKARIISKTVATGAGAGPPQPRSANGRRLGSWEDGQRADERISDDNEDHHSLLRSRSFDDRMRFRRFEHDRATGGRRFLGSWPNLPANRRGRRAGEDFMPLRKNAGLVSSGGSIYVLRSLAT